MSIKKIGNVNTAILSFMGVEVRGYGDTKRYVFKKEEFPDLTYEGWQDEGENIVSLSLKYHKSWDWLIPVINKCFKLFLEENDGDGTRLKDCFTCMRKGDKLGAYRNVFLFINSLTGNNYSD